MRYPALPLLLLLLNLGRRSCTAALPSPHPHVLSPVSTFLPYCMHLASNLRPEDQALLRTKVQASLHLRKRQLELQEFIHMNEHMPADPSLQHAFKTHKSVPQLKSELELNQVHLNRVTLHLNNLIDQLRQSGHLPANATMNYVSQCVSTRLEPNLYPDRPQVSFLLQYFKRPKVIERYVSRLKAVAQHGIPTELLVNVDNVDEHQQWAQLSTEQQQHGSGDGSTAAAFSVVPVLSNNVHEARAYNRLASLARAPILVLLQDDDLPPQDTVWVQHLLRVMDKYPRAGAVGMQSHRYCVHGFGNNYQGNFYFHDAQLGIKLNFAGVVDFAPMAVRREVFEAVGGLDEGMSDAGQCGIFGDWELTTRMWVAGWQVLFMEVRGREGDGEDGGTHKPETGARCWQRQAHCASTVFYSRFDALLPAVCSHVQELNVQQLQVLDVNAPCPYGPNKCTKAG